MTAAMPSKDHTTESTHTPELSEGQFNLEISRASTTPPLVGGSPQSSDSPLFNVTKPATTHPRMQQVSLSKVYNDYGELQNGSQPLQPPHSKDMTELQILRAITRGFHYNVCWLFIWLSSLVLCCSTIEIHFLNVCWMIEDCPHFPLPNDRDSHYPEASQRLRWLGLITTLLPHDWRVSMNWSSRRHLLFSFSRCPAQ